MQLATKGQRKLPHNTGCEEWENTGLDALNVKTRVGNAKRGQVMTWLKSSATGFVYAEPITISVWLRSLLVNCENTNGRKVCGSTFTKELKKVTNPVHTTIPFKNIFGICSSNVKMYPYIQYSPHIRTCIGYIVTLWWNITTTWRTVSPNQCSHVKGCHNALR